MCVLVVCLSFATLFYVLYDFSKPFNLHTLNLDIILFLTLMLIQNLYENN